MSEQIGKAKLALNLWTRDHGTRESQLNDLAELILTTFENPALWPMTDERRIEALQRFYQLARDIRHTELLIKANQ